MAAQFPRRSADGSFCVRLTYRVASEEPEQLASRMRTWLADWVAENRHWRLSPARSHDFLEDFEAPPHSLDCSEAEASYCLDGKATSAWWRDWLAIRLVPEFLAAFPEVVALRDITNCQPQP